MKKVLSLSVLLLSLYSQVAYGIDLRGRRGGSTNQPAAQPQKQAAPAGGNAGSATQTLTTAEALVQAGVNLDDVAAALQALGANPSNAKKSATAKSFIQSGSATMPSSINNKKLGRLGNKK